MKRESERLRRQVRKGGGGSRCERTSGVEMEDLWTVVESVEANGAIRVHMEDVEGVSGGKEVDEEHVEE